MKRFLFITISVFLSFISCSHGKNSATGTEIPEIIVPELNDSEQDNSSPQDMDNEGSSVAKTLKIGLFADPQYADVDNRGPRHYRSSLLKLPECIDTFNQEKVDMVVCLGDIVDRNPDELDVLLPIFAECKSPMYYVLGNHDFSRLKDVDGHMKKLGMPSLYYSIKKDGWKFIFLNTNELARYSPMTPEQEKEFNAMHELIAKEGSPNGENWNGGLSKSQLDWLKSELSESWRVQEKVVVFGHHPLEPMTNHTLLNAGEVIELLTSYPCVKAYLNGHYHPGAYVSVDGLPCITHEAMLEGGERNSYSIMTLEDNRITLKGYGRVGDHVYDIK